METLWQDLRVAGRSMTADSAIAAAAVVALALSTRRSRLDPARALRG